MVVTEGGYERPTTAEGLREALSCWTRRNILLALCGPRRTAGELAEALGLRPSHLSNHTRVLSDLGLASVEAAGLKRYWALRPSVRIGWRSAGIAFRLRSTDSCIIAEFISSGSSEMRLLAIGIKAAGRQVPRAPRVVTVRPAPTPGRTPSAPTRGRRASGRG
jgi:DNA-binding transcriptional ArsR family regulator